MPDALLDMKMQLSFTHKADDGTVPTLTSQLRQIDSVWYLVFNATEFSPYALVLTARVFTMKWRVYRIIGSEETKMLIGFLANGKFIAPFGVTVLYGEPKGAYRHQFSLGKGLHRVCK